MIPLSYRSSPARGSSASKTYCDPTRRRMIYGPIQPMVEARGLLHRLFGVR
jgi:hypothetical protein